MRKEKTSFLYYLDLNKITVFFLKKLFFSFWFYFLVILVPFLFCFSFLTQTPDFLVIDSVITFSVIFNVLLFYGILFFNFHRSHFYPLISQKFNDRKILIYFPIFLNLIIVVIFTTIIAICFFAIFESLDWLFLQTWTYNDNYYYQIKDIKDFDWGLLIYYLIITFLVTFTLAFLIQTLSNNFNTYLLFCLFIIILEILFSGTFGIVSAFDTPRFKEGTEDNLLYSYNQNTQVLTFKPYFDRNDPDFYDKRFFTDFSVYRFIQMFNPYYYLTAWGQFDIFVDFYRTTSLTLPGIDPISINPNDPSTWVKYDYIMFSFTNWLWSSYIFVPYIFVFFYGILGIIITKKVKIYHN
ncbi:hypothetical protein X271_00312 [Candidatus Hepatoplasma crinochetorum Av]|uniref:Uncharacterized protein n=1 Tax=Candidatus Hepatoplasma crinochetorum Av TaxID=1427984 RepID=W8GFS5_9MOLU|nr:hypothetical protein [Candidatus Hepatoplasma crinochetorum]AHK22418.1 hypothetical protein X271_00312 [Candidatus Hepatoplasma crinochetorum Av]